MQLIHNILSFNQILTVSLLGWLVAQVLKTIINFILLGKFQLERMWVMAVCPVPTAQRSVPWSLQPDAVWALTLPFCSGKRGGNHYHARCHGRAA